VVEFGLSAVRASGKTCLVSRAARTPCSLSRCAAETSRRAAADARLLKARAGSRPMGEGHTTGRGHRSNPRGAEAARHRRVAIGDTAAMCQVVNPAIAGKGRMRIDRFIARAIDGNIVAVPVDRSPTPHRAESATAIIGQKPIAYPGSKANPAGIGKKSGRYSGARQAP